jgi:predicted transcriptional regulator of viral defense system
MDSLGYFATHPVFTFEEFTEAHKASGGGNTHTISNLLAHHVISGNLIRVRRSLYATVPRGVDSKTATVDPYMLSCKLVAGGVVAYHAALQFRGKAYSVWNRFHYLSRTRCRRFSFRGAEFVAIQPPLPIRNLSDFGGGVVEERISGGTVRVTTFERTLVDVLDAPECCGGWEEVWRSLEMVEFFDLDAVVAFALKCGSSLTVGRVGFFLEQNRERLMVEDRHLAQLKERAPKQPRYLDSRRESGRLASTWNLVVPERVLNREWEEVS